MKNNRNLIRIIVGKAALLAALLFVLVAAEIPSFAQSAEVRYAGVFYQNNPGSEKAMYCDYTTGSTGTRNAGSETNEDLLTRLSYSQTLNVYHDGTAHYITTTENLATRWFCGVDWVANHSYSVGNCFRRGPVGNYTYYTVVKAGTSGSTWAPTMTSETVVTSVAESVNDGELTLSKVSCSTTISAAPRTSGGAYRSDTYYYLEFDNTVYTTQKKYCFKVNSFGPNAYTISVADGSVSNRSFIFEPQPASASHGNDPWVSSALIEYDQPFPTSETPGTNEYPNHCLALCMNVYCNNKPIGGSTYSIAFPLQNIKFDVVKYYNNKNVENPEETPAIRTIDLYPNQESAKCGSYKCPGGVESGNTCGGALYYVETDGMGTCSESSGVYTCTRSDCKSFADNSAHSCTCTGGTKPAGATTSGGYSCDYAVWNNDGTSSNGNAAIPFCAAWDGSYEINGEFGKTNGNFAFRATVKTDVPGDNVIVDKITFDSTIAYPGMNQIPIQVDVTNLHTVRSTPSVVGNITKVDAQPYTYAYRLSKDADVRIAIFDASNGDDIAYTDGTNTAIGSSTTTASGLIVRNLVDWQPRLGEGMKGVEKDVNIQAFDSWDGRNDQGLFLPAGNYIVALQAKSADEWSGVDFSRAVTRQLSLDPLKLTDIVSSGLTKKSTAYASIAYTPTESSKVYWYIYTPGTTFDGSGSTAGVLTNSATPVGTAPKVTMDGGTPSKPTGYLVNILEEDRVGRMNFNSRWDGTCGINSLIERHVAHNQIFPPGANSNSTFTGTDLSGQVCTTAGGCSYYLRCQRRYAQGEKLSTGAVCTDAAGCEETFAYGAPMNDGNYVYALWAEIPYNGKYVNAVGGNGTPAFTAGAECANPTNVTGTANDAEINRQCFTGVKTLKYNTGEIAIERGVVDVTIQPVSYATVGSSPTAYGLDPFIFKYSIARDATAIAKVTNTAGVDVKYLTPEEGVTQVAQQMNTLSWDGRDDAGRMVTPGTYMFVVETKDAMFPAVTNRASAVFPVDMYRVVDLSTTDVYGDSEARATLSYSLSKAMSVQLNIYNKDVVIPDYTSGAGEYTNVTGTATGVTYAANTGVAVTATLSDASTFNGTATADVVLDTANPPTYRDTITVSPNPLYDGTSTVCTVTNPSSCAYRVNILREYITVPTTTAVWPPRICDQNTDGGANTVFYVATDPEVTAGTATVGAVAPRKQPKCIYVKDAFFTNYPANANIAASGVVDVRLQPIKTFERSSLKPGDGLQITEEWDALYFRNPVSAACAGATDLRQCSYEMVPDGQYPFFVSARSNEPFDRYYSDGTEPIPGTTPVQKYLPGAPFKNSSETITQSYLYATDKNVGKVNVTRGAVYFLDGSTVVYPNAPQLFNVSSGPVFVPPYEINFSVSRAATVEIAIVALQAGVCNPDPAIHQDLKNNAPGDVCKFLSTMTIANTGHFDPNIVRKAYWDGTDNNGFYVKPGIYEVRLTARNYPNPDLYEPTVKQITLNADLLKVFDLLEADGYSISQRGTTMRIGYQISVPMKVALQIFKPGTTIYDYEKGTLRNPTTGTEVKDIREVLVKSIVGIRPATTLIEEIWDGTDYAGQEVPDGTYPFRFVTALNSADIDSVTGEMLAGDDSSATPTDWKIQRVADTYEYQNLHKATIAIGDGRFVCADWEKTVFFYPNPLTDASKGTLEITKMPVPGEVSIKFFNLAGDLVRAGNYECVDANNSMVTMGNSLAFNPDNTPEGSSVMTPQQLDDYPNVRNAALRCRWDRTNQHGKKVARGVYFGLVDFKARMGREHCQKVVKVLIP